MDEKLRELQEKARQTCRRASSAAADAAYLASHQAVRLMDSAKLRLRLVELENRRDRELRRVGELVYATHTGDPTDSEALLEQLRTVDGVNEQIAEVNGELVRRNGGQICQRCGGASGGDDRFCRHCGAKL